MPAFAVSFREGIQSSHGCNGIQIEHVKKKIPGDSALGAPVLGPGERVHVI